MKKRTFLLILPAVLEIIVVCCGVIAYRLRYSAGVWFAPFTPYVAAAAVVVTGLSVCCYWWKKRPILCGIFWLSILIAAVNGLYLFVTIGGLGFGYYNWALIVLAAAECILAVIETPEKSK